MKTTYLDSILLVLLVLFSLDAGAAEGKYSLGLGIGKSQFDLNEANIIANYSSLTSTSTFTDSSTAFTFFGGIQLDQYLSLEADFLFAGDVVATDAGQQIKLFDVSTLAFTVALSKRVSESIRLFARLGAHWWDISASFGDQPTINNAVDLTYGLGADFNLYGDGSRQLRVQWNHYEYDGVFIDYSDTLTMSLLFLFGGDY
jgi:hypothetical protein